MPSFCPFGKAGGLQIRRWQVFAVKCYGFTLAALTLEPSDFCNNGVKLADQNEFGNYDINQISSDDVRSFLNRHTEGCKPYTKRIRYAQLSAFFNYQPKSGKEHKIVFIPQKVADRLREYVMQVCESPEDRIFPIS